jgi:hypothetical protein
MMKRLWSVLLLLGVLGGCGVDDGGETPTTMVDGTRQVFRFQSEATAPVAEGVNAFTLGVKRKADDAAVTAATVRVRAFMPAHAHDSPTTPVVEERGEGNYQVTNVSFSMAGDWEVTYTVTQGMDEDTATFLYTVQ